MDLHNSKISEQKVIFCDAQITIWILVFAFLSRIAQHLQKQDQRMGDPVNIYGKEHFIAAVKENIPFFNNNGKCGMVLL